MGRYVFKLPDVGEGIAEAEIAAWHVGIGDKVDEDQHLVDMMTDKATVEVGSPVTGTVIALHGKVGEKVAVGSALVELETAAEGAAPESASGQTAAAAPESSSPLANIHAFPDMAKRPAEDAPIPPRPLASPAVRRRARERGVELSAVRGTGPEGRVTAADLESYRSEPPAANAQRTNVEEVQIIGLRRKIAERMQEATRRIPHFSYIEEADVTELEDLRAHLNSTKREDQPKLTLLPFLMRALVRLLPDYPQINALYDDAAGILRRYAAIHIGIATQTSDGLMVPVVRHAEARDLWDCARELMRVSSAARDGSARRAELTGSTITITSLGPLGGIAHTPVINHPEVAIIGPNKIVERPVVRQGTVAVRKMMNISSSFDHRIVDGYDAAAFVQGLKALLEHPATIFME